MEWRDVRKIYFYENMPRLRDARDGIEDICDFFVKEGVKLSGLGDLFGCMEKSV